MIAINWRTGMGVIAEDNEIVQFNHSESKCDHNIDDNTSECWWVDGEWMNGHLALELIAGSDHPSSWRKFVIEVWLTMPDEMMEMIWHVGETTHPEHDIIVLNVIELDMNNNSDGRFN